MKTNLCLMAVLATALSAPTCVVAADDLSARLQKGLFEEEANRNLDAAIQAYRSVVVQFDKDRQLAATAVFRLAECYRKLGKTNDAVVQYQRLLGEFAEQTTLVNLSRQNLVGLGVTPTPSAEVPALSKSARAEQRRLLEEEINLVETELKGLKQQFAVGVVGQEALNKKQREILGLRRQLAALEDEPPSAPAGDAGLAATDEEQKEVQRIKALIQNSPDLINARETGNYQGTPLHRAAMAGHLNVAQFLLLNGADIEATDGRNFTPLHWAANNGHKALVELLLANKAAGGGKQNAATPLHLAAANGHKLVVATLLEHKANVNARSASGWTPLHNASLYGFKAVAEVLMQHKADVNAASLLTEDQYPPGSTPLHIAAAKGNLGMVEWLCANGADVNAKDKVSETALHKVAGKGSKPLVALLLARKADVNAKNATETTPLLIAADTPNADVVELLLAHSAEVNAQDTLRRSSVHKAVARKSEDVLKALLTAKPNLEIRDNEDFTPLQRAVLGRSDELVELLLNAGANPNVVYEQQGETPLHWAVKNGQRKSVESLLAHHANVNAQDFSGKSALDYVKGSGASPPGGVLPPFSVRTLRLNQPGQATEPRPEAIADLLRKAGASEDLQRRASIGITRSGRDVNPRLFFRGTNAHNRYRLFEAIASFYQSQDSFQRLPFPDFTRVRINRNEPQEDKMKDLKVDVETILKSGECSHDIWLEWGDLVDVPEQDHPINQQWSGLPSEISDALRKCLERTITVVVKGESTTLKLVPNVQTASRLGLGGVPVVAPRTADAKRTSLSTFRLRETIYAAGVLRASSDVTRVTVKRTDPITKEKLELLFNLDKVDPQTDLWLRDGDVIEIPEK